MHIGLQCSFQHSIDPVPNRLVATPAVSNFDCSLVESLQWGNSKLATQLVTPTNSLFRDHKSICTNNFAPLVRTLIHSAAHHCTSALSGNSDCPNSEDTPHSFPCQRLHRSRLTCSSSTPVNQSATCINIIQTIVSSIDRSSGIDHTTSSSIHSNKSFSGPSPSMISIQDSHTL